VQRTAEAVQCPRLPANLGVDNAEINSLFALAFERSPESSAENPNFARVRQVHFSAYAGFARDHVR
jgi:hypothetical protein